VQQVPSQIYYYFSFVISLSYKSKQYLLGTLKVLILAVAFGYLYYKVSEIPTSLWTYFDFVNTKNTVGISLLFFIGLAILNWGLEIIKWQLLASYLFPISFGRAAKESLASLTVSIATPNRIGEYGAKAMYYTKTERKQILVLTFLGNAAQLLATLIFGTFGLWHTIAIFDIAVNKTALFLAVLGLGIALFALYYFRKTTWGIKGFTFQNIWTYLNALATLKKIKVISLAFLRYLVFSYLFYEVLLFFLSLNANAETFSMTEIMPIIFTMYLFVSIIPTLAIFDVAVKGSIAIWLFGLLGVPDIPVLATVFVMWVLNVAIPAGIGSFFVITYKATNT
jgi:hypothetical protein